MGYDLTILCRGSTVSDVAALRTRHQEEGREGSHGGVSALHSLLSFDELCFLVSSLAKNC